MILRGYLLGLLYGIACLVLALIAYKLGLPKKYTRKIVHILVGFEWVILYGCFGASYHFLIVCLFFLALLLVSYFAKLLPMISSENENSPGTVFYGVAMSVVALVGLFEPRIMLPFGVGIACTSIGDGLAGVVGQLVKKHNPKIYRNKSVWGTLTNLLVSFASAIALSAIYQMKLNPLHCLAIAVLSCGIELIVGFGMDNIAVTWATTLLGYSFMYLDGVGNYIVPIIMTPFVIAFVLEKRALTKWATAMAVFMDLVVTLAFGNFGFLTLMTFFVGSVVIDKIKKRAKSVKLSDETLKHGTRDTMQVIANGIVPTASACAFVFSHGNPAFAITFVASLAEAFGDTAASGLGAFSKKTFDPFRWRKCTGGISGGMSVIGTVSALFGSLFVSSLAILLTWNSFNINYALIAVIAAFIGTLIDSLLGSLLQVKYKCSTCGTFTEKKQHCGVGTIYFEGLSFVDNDIVNVSSSFFTAVIAFLLATLAF